MAKPYAVVLRMPLIDVMLMLRVARHRERVRWLPFCMIAHARLRTLPRKAGQALPDKSIFLPLHLRTVAEVELAMSGFFRLYTDEEIDEAEAHYQDAVERDERRKRQLLIPSR